MSDTIDIHQLDSQRQVLFLLNEESDGTLPIQEIKAKLIAYGISPETKTMKSFLSQALRDKRRKIFKDGLIYETQNSYKIMQKGIEYLKRTILVIDPSKEGSKYDAIGHIMSTLSGNIKICDPYFDETAYGLLKDWLDPKKINSIKVIYSKSSLDSTKHYKIGSHSLELKKKKDIHDRFVIDDKHLYFFGTSLNSIGKKLSFMFNLTTYKNTFENFFQKYWGKS